MSDNLNPKLNDLERIGEEKGYIITVDAEKASGDFVDLSGLKLANDGKTVLIPQPSDDPNDPLNWSYAKKMSILLVVGAISFLPGQLRSLILLVSNSC
jgi:hypothetical protein